MAPGAVDPPEQDEAAFASAKQHRLKPKTHPRAKASADLKRLIKKVEPASDVVKEAVAQFDAIQAEKKGSPLPAPHPDCEHCKERLKRQAELMRKKRAAK